MTFMTFKCKRGEGCMAPLPCALAQGCMCRRGLSLSNDYLTCFICCASVREGDAILRENHVKCHLGLCPFTPVPLTNREMLQALFLMGVVHARRGRIRRAFFSAVQGGPP